MFNINHYEELNRDEFIDKLIEWDLDFNYVFENNTTYMICGDQYVYELDPHEDINDLTCEAFCEYRVRMKRKAS